MGKKNQDPDPVNKFLGLKYLKFFDAEPGSGNLLTLDPRWKKLGSEIYIPDP